MSSAQAESVIRNIIREIASECAGKGQAVSETLVAFVVKAVVLDPSNGFNVDRALTKDDVQRLIGLCVSRLLETVSPSLDTIKMQVYFDMNYAERRDFLNEHRRVLDSRLLPVVREITDSRARTRDELESLYRKIVSAVLLRSGLGSPTDIAVVREATAALNSIFPATELGTFLALDRKDKERQLAELTSLVTGIRLFNKECGKGGEGIDDLPGILNEAVPATSHNLNMTIQETIASADRLTVIVEKIQGGEMETKELDVNVVKDSLLNIRQYESFLRIIMTDVVACAKQVESLEQQFASVLQQLQATVQSKTAVPTAQVYPLFVDLATLWTGFQDEMVLLSVLSNVLTSLQPFSQSHKQLFPPEVLAPHLELLTVKSREDRRFDNCGHGQKINPLDFKHLEWIFPETTKNFDQINLMYKGYCGWALVKYDRLLLHGIPEIGALKYGEKVFAFSSIQAATEFAMNPEWFIQQVAECAKKSPELIQLLELHQQFATITPYSASREGKMIEKPITKAEQGSQTDTHFYESNIVKTYEWNEWELRRKAIKLANLRTRITHSMQTNLSNFRRDNVSQVYLPKDQLTMTLGDNYSNVEKPQTYLAGLRGCGMETSTTMTKVDLTLDVADNASHFIVPTKYKPAADAVPNASGSIILASSSKSSSKSDAGV